MKFADHFNKANQERLGEPFKRLLLAQMLRGIKKTPSSDRPFFTVKDEHGGDNFRLSKSEKIDEGLIEEWVSTLLLFQAVDFKFLVEVAHGREPKKSKKIKEPEKPPEGATKSVVKKYNVAFQKYKQEIKKYEDQQEAYRRFAIIIKEFFRSNAFDTRFGGSFTLYKALFPSVRLSRDEVKQCHEGNPSDKIIIDINKGIRALVNSVTSPKEEKTYAEYLLGVMSGDTGSLSDPELQAVAAATVLDFGSLKRSDQIDLSTLETKIANTEYSLSSGLETVESMVARSVYCLESFPHFIEDRNKKRKEEKLPELDVSKLNEIIAAAKSKNPEKSEFKLTKGEVKFFKEVDDALSHAAKEVDDVFVVESESLSVKPAVLEELVQANIDRKEAEEKRREEEAKAAEVAEKERAELARLLSRSKEQADEEAKAEPDEEKRRPNIHRDLKAKLFVRGFAEAAMKRRRQAQVAALTMALGVAQKSGKEHKRSRMATMLKAVGVFRRYGEINKDHEESKKEGKPIPWPAKPGASTVVDKDPKKIQARLHREVEEFEAVIEALGIYLAENAHTTAKSGEEIPTHANNIEKLVRSDVYRKLFENSLAYMALEENERYKLIVPPISKETIELYRRFNSSYIDAVRSLLRIKSNPLTPLTQDTIDKEVEGLLECLGPVSTKVADSLVSAQVKSRSSFSFLGKRNIIVEDRDLTDPFRALFIVVPGPIEKSDEIETKKTYADLLYDYLNTRIAKAEEKGEEAKKDKNAKLVIKGFLDAIKKLERSIKKSKSDDEINTAFTEFNDEIKEHLARCQSELLNGLKEIHFQIRDDAKGDEQGPKKTSFAKSNITGQVLSNLDITLNGINSKAVLPFFNLISKEKDSSKIVGEFSRTVYNMLNRSREFLVANEVRGPVVLKDSEQVSGAIKSLVVEERSEFDKAVVRCRSEYDEQQKKLAELVEELEFVKAEGKRLEEKRKEVAKFLKEKFAEDDKNYNAFKGDFEPYLFLGLRTNSQGVKALPSKPNKILKGHTQVAQQSFEDLPPEQQKQLLGAEVVARMEAASQREKELLARDKKQQEKIRQLEERLNEVLAELGSFRGGASSEEMTSFQRRLAKMKDELEEQKARAELLSKRAEESSREDFVVTLDSFDEGAKDRVADLRSNPRFSQTPNSRFAQTPSVHRGLSTPIPSRKTPVSSRTTTLRKKATPFFASPRYVKSSEFANYRFKKGDEFYVEGEDELDLSTGLHGGVSIDVDVEYLYRPPEVKYLFERIGSRGGIYVVPDPVVMIASLGDDISTELGSYVKSARDKYEADESPDKKDLQIVVPILIEGEWKAVVLTDSGKGDKSFQAVILDPKKRVHEADLSALSKRVSGMLSSSGISIDEEVVVRKVLVSSVVKEGEEAVFEGVSTKDSGPLIAAAVDHLVTEGNLDVEEVKLENFNIVRSRALDASKLAVDGLFSFNGIRDFELLTREIDERLDRASSRGSSSDSDRSSDTDSVLEKPEPHTSRELDFGESPGFGKGSDLLEKLRYWSNGTTDIAHRSWRGHKAIIQNDGVDSEVEEDESKECFSIKMSNGLLLLEFSRNDDGHVKVKDCFIPNKKDKPVKYFDSITAGAADYLLEKYEDVVRVNEISYVYSKLESEFLRQSKEDDNLDQSKGFNSFAIGFGDGEINVFRKRDSDTGIVSFEINGSYHTEDKGEIDIRECFELRKIGDVQEVCYRMLDDKSAKELFRYSNNTSLSTKNDFDININLFLFERTDRVSEAISNMQGVKTSPAKKSVSFSKSAPVFEESPERSVAASTSPPKTPAPSRVSPRFETPSRFDEEGILEEKSRGIVVDDDVERVEVGGGYSSAVKAPYCDDKKVAVVVGNPVKQDANIVRVIESKGVKKVPTTSNLSLVSKFDLEKPENNHVTSEVMKLSDENHYYAEFLGLVFDESKVVKDDDGKNVGDGVFNGAKLFMANFRKCEFVGVDFSKIPEDIFRTIAFANCSFEKCVFPDGQTPKGPNNIISKTRPLLLEEVDSEPEVEAVEEVRGHHLSAKERFRRNLKESGVFKKKEETEATIGEKEQKIDTVLDLFEDAQDFREALAEETKRTRNREELSDIVFPQSKGVRMPRGVRLSMRNLGLFRGGGGSSGA